MALWVPPAGSRGSRRKLAAGGLCSCAYVCLCVLACACLCVCLTVIKDLHFSKHIRRTRGTLDLPPPRSPRALLDRVSRAPWLSLVSRAFFRSLGVFRALVLFGSLSLRDSLFSTLPNTIQGEPRSDTANFSAGRHPRALRAPVWMSLHRPPFFHLSRPAFPALYKVSAPSKQPTPPLHPPTTGTAVLGLSLRGLRNSADAPPRARLKC